MTEEDKKKEEEKKRFTSPFDEVGKALYEEWASRPAFSYDVGSDPLYAQYRDRYVTEGKRAMQDTMGRAAAATGGYGNSFAVSAGQQAFDASLSDLADVVPELYALAYDRYETEGDELLRRIDVAGEFAERDYERYRDEVEDERYEEEQALEAELREEERAEKEKIENEKLESDERWPDGVHAEDIVVAGGVWRGVSREEGIATMIKAGVSDALVDGLMSAGAWSRGKLIYKRDGVGDEGVFGFDNYEAYLSNYVTRALSTVV